MKRALAWLTLAAALAGSAAAQEPEQPNGIFLVAKAHMNDPNFRETVVLVTQHGSGGPVGVIVNRPTQVPLSQLFPDNAPLQKAADLVFVGGPVQPQLLVYVFKAQETPKDALNVLPGVYMSFSPELLTGLLARARPTEGLRVYAGYAGWARGQLQHEIARGDWWVMQVDAATIFDKDPAKAWQELSRKASTKQTRASVP